MSDTILLGKRRTVRFTAAVDRLLESVAAQKNRSVSDIIRLSVQTGIENRDTTAGDWVLGAASRRRPRRADAARLAFQKKWKERHQ